MLVQIENLHFYCVQYIIFSYFKIEKQGNANSNRNSILSSHPVLSEHSKHLVKINK